MVLFMKCEAVGLIACIYTYLYIHLDLYGWVNHSVKGKQQPSSFHSTKCIRNCSTLQPIFFSLFIDLFMHHELLLDKNTITAKMITTLLANYTFQILSQRCSKPLPACSLQAPNNAHSEWMCWDGFLHTVLACFHHDYIRHKSLIRVQVKCQSFEHQFRCNYLGVDSSPHQRLQSTFLCHARELFWVLNPQVAGELTIIPVQTSFFFCVQFANKCPDHHALWHTGNLEGYGKFVTAEEKLD